MALWGKTLAVELDGLSSGMLGIERENHILWIGTSLTSDFHSFTVTYAPTHIHIT